MDEKLKQLQAEFDETRHRIEKLCREQGKALKRLMPMDDEHKTDRAEFWRIDLEIRELRLKQLNIHDKMFGIVNLNEGKEGLAQ